MRKLVFFVTKIALMLGIVALLDMIGASKAFAWGPGVHTVIALHTLDMARDLFPGIGSIIASNPLEYLYGSLAADFFLMKSQIRSTRHAHHWKGGFAFLNEARNATEQAYAYGFLAHLAADVIAHNVFIPNLVAIFPNKRRTGHIYWEIRADYVVGPLYTKIAKDVLGTDQRACDEILRSMTHKRKNGLKASKRIYTQGVRISDYLYDTVPGLFGGKTLRWDGFRDYVVRMVMVSSLFVEEFLRDPPHSVCLKHDPNGKGKAKPLRRQGLFARLFSSRRPYLPTPRNQEIFRI
ncbi:MAG: hypothetical protein DRG63_12185 [Deltaproteobacteria bacterium]|nr:MAG: hypothetical protein DRG63_12185 [Deltaproteobacteria bacterium]RLB24840.1 MAG: hypothetical protein DRG76_00010 [Deltaproteobacteria bacterium]